MHYAMGWLWKWDDYNPHVGWLQSSHPPPVVDPPPTWTARHRSHPSARRSKGPSPRFGSQRGVPRVFFGMGKSSANVVFLLINTYTLCVYIYMYTQTYYYNMNMYIWIWICMCVCIHISCMTVWLSMVDFHELDTSGQINGESHEFFCRVRLRVAHIPKMAGENSE